MAMVGMKVRANAARTHNRTRMHQVMHHRQHEPHLVPHEDPNAAASVLPHPDPTQHKQRPGPSTGANETPPRAGMKPDMNASHWRLLTKSFRHDEESTLSEVALNVIKLQQHKHKYFINPEDMKKVTWDLVISAFIVYSCMVVPLRIGFNVQAEGFWSVVDTIVDYAFGLDMALSFRTAYYDDKQQLVWGARRIFWNYLKGGFALDFVSTVPFDTLLAAFVGGGSAVLRSTKLLRALRLIRLLRLMRLIKLGKFFSRFSEDVSVNQSLLQLLKMMTFIMVCGHFLACAWFLVGSFEDTGANWIDAYGVRDLPLSRQYMVSLYWGFTTMTTVGYGDINTNNAGERIMAIFSMLVGASIFGYVVGNVTVLLENINARRALQKEKMDLVKEFVRDRKLPPYLSMKVKRHFKYFYGKKSVFEEQTMLDNLPSSLRGTVSQFGNEKLISRTPLFDMASPVIISNLLVAMRPFTLPAHHCVYTQGDIGPELLIVIKGDVALLWDTVVPDIPASLETKQGVPLTKYERRLASAMRAFKRRRVEEEADPRERPIMRCGLPVTNEMLESHVQVQLLHPGNHFGSESAFEPEARLLSAVTVNQVELGSIKKDELAEYWPEAYDMFVEEGAAIRKRISAFRKARMALKAQSRLKTISSHSHVSDGSGGSPAARLAASRGGPPPMTAHRTISSGEDSDDDCKSESDLQSVGSLQDGEEDEEEEVGPLLSDDNALQPAQPGRPSTANATQGARGRDGPDAAAGGGGADAGAGHTIKPVASSRSVGAQPAPDSPIISRAHLPSYLRPSLPGTAEQQATSLSPTTTPSPGAGSATPKTPLAPRERELLVPLAYVQRNLTLDHLDHFIDPLYRPVLTASDTTGKEMLHSDSWAQLKNSALGASSNSVVPMQLENDSPDIPRLGDEAASSHTAVTPIPNVSSGHLGTSPPRVGTRRVIRQLGPTEDRSSHSWWRRHTMHPHSAGKLRWDLVLTVFILYSAVVVPFQIGFEADNTVLRVFNTCADMIFVIDIVINFFTGYITDLGYCVRVPKLVAVHYLKTWCFIDVVSTVPLQSIVEFLSGGGGSPELKLTRLLRTLRLFRLFKLARFIKLEKMFGHYEDVLSVNPSVMRMGKLAVVMMFIAHLNGCLWYGITGGSDDGTWPAGYCIAQPPDYDTSVVCLSEMDVSQKYLTSIYWAFTTMTTVGYGDVTPDKSNIGELIVAMLSMLLGTTVFAHVITSVMNMVVNFDPAERLTKQTLVQLNDYMKEKRLPTAFRRQLRAHYRHYLKVTSVLPQTQQVFQDLPLHLRRMVIEHVYLQSVYTIPILKRSERHYSGLVAQLALVMKPVQFAKGAVVVRLNDTARIIYFVTNGLIHVYDDDQNLLRQVVDGQYFGESAMWTPDHHAYRSKISARASFMTHLFTMSRNDFLNVKMNVSAAAATYLEQRLRAEGNLQEWASHGEPEGDSDDDHQDDKEGGPEGNKSKKSTRRKAKRGRRGKKKGKMGKFG